MTDDAKTPTDPLAGWSALVAALVAQALDPCADAATRVAELSARCRQWGRIPAEGLRALDATVLGESVEHVILTLLALPTDNEALLRYLRAMYAVQHMEYDRLDELYQDVLRLEPDSFYVLSRLAWRAGADRQLELLERAFAAGERRSNLDRQIDAAFPHWIQSLSPSEVGTRLIEQYESTGRHDDALVVAERAAELAPDRAQVWLNLGTLRTGQKQHEQAIAAYDRFFAVVEHDEFLRTYAAFSVGSSDPRGAAYFNRACERAITGHADAALTDLAAAIAVSHTWAAAAREDDYFRILWDDAEFVRITSPHRPENDDGEETS